MLESRKKSRTYLSVYIIAALVFQTFSQSKAIDDIKIGVLIKHRGLEEPLNRTLEMLNANTSVLFATRLIAVVEVLESDNSYQASAAGKYNRLDLN